MTSVPAQNALVILAVVSSTVGMITDLRSRRIPNWLTSLTAVLGVGLHGLVGGWREAGSCVLALCAAGSIFLLFYLAGGMGAGDVKMMAAEGCLLGLGDVPLLLTLTALVGGVLAVATASAHTRLAQTVRNIGLLTMHHLRQGLVPHAELHAGNRKQLRLPYAVAIAAGVFLTLLVRWGQA